MHSARRLSFLIGALIFVVLMALVIYGVQAFQRDAEALQTAGQEDISWSTGQLELELMRFRAELWALQSQDPTNASSPATLNNRFDILWSRVSIFQRGRIGERLMTYDADSRVVARLFATMQAFETQIVTLQPDNANSIIAIERAFQPFGDELREFSRRVTLGEQRISADIRAQLRNGAQRTIVILAAATILLLIALGIIWRDSRRYRVLAARNERLAEKANRASRAKSQFLTMMSHELRTPMNGVLGLLALARQTKLTVAVDRTLGQAERSAKQLIGLLTDILDFSALQSKELPIEKSPISMVEFASKLREQYDQPNATLGVIVEPQMPLMLAGDEKRLCQIFAYLTGYLIETAGVDNVSLTLSHQNGLLKGDISYHYRGGDIWHPDLLSDGELQDIGQKNNANFSTGAVGPTIARGLCAQMGGQIKVEPDEGQGGHVVVEIPAAIATTLQIHVRVEARTPVMKKICEVALRDSRIVVLAPDSADHADVVLIESTGDDDPAQFKLLQRANPKARLVGLGKIADTSLFDQCLAHPIDVAGLRAAIKGILPAA